MSELESTGVRYTAKELFAQINSKLDVITATLTNKVDHEDLVLLDARVTALEAIENQRKGSGRTQKAILAALLAIAGLLVPIVVVLLQSQ